MKKKNYTPSRSNFQTHKLCFSQNSIKPVPTLKSFLFYGIFAFIGTAILIIGAIQLSPKELAGLFIWFALFGGAGFYGIFSTYYKKYPEIDLINNIFYPEGRPSRYMIHDDSGIPLNQLKKINVEKIYHRGSKSSYYYYTMHLDFGGGKTFYFLGHGALKLFVKDADKLSSILNIQITPDEYHSWLSPSKERKNNLALLIFGIIWTTITSIAIYSKIDDISAGNMNNEPEWSLWILLIFPLSGLLMLISAIFSLSRKQ